MQIIFVKASYDLPYGQFAWGKTNHTLKQFTVNFLSRCRSIFLTSVKSRISSETLSGMTLTSCAALTIDLTCEGINTGRGGPCGRPMQTIWAGTGACIYGFWIPACAGMTNREFLLPAGEGEGKDGFEGLRATARVAPYVFAINGQAQGRPLHVEIIAD